MSVTMSWRLLTGPMPDTSNEPSMRRPVTVVDSVSRFSRRTAVSSEVESGGGDQWDGGYSRGPSRKRRRPGPGAVVVIMSPIG